MHTQNLDLDEHACLWPDLTIHTRHVAGHEDITVGTHPVLGLCVISHYGFGGLVEWITRTPIPDELTNFEGYGVAVEHEPETSLGMLLDRVLGALSTPHPTSSQVDRLSRNRHG